MGWAFVDVSKGEKANKKGEREEGEGVCVCVWREGRKGCVID